MKSTTVALGLLPLAAHAGLRFPCSTLTTQRLDVEKFWVMMAMNVLNVCMGQANLGQSPSKLKPSSIP